MNPYSARNNKVAEAEAGGIFRRLLQRRTAARLRRKVERLRRRRANQAAARARRRAKNRVRDAIAFESRRRNR